LRFTVTARLAEQFNQELQDYRADAKAGTGDEPYLDFNHADAERSAEVTELYWGGDDPKTGGIRARVAWSSAGKDAILGKVYRRFSPSWDFDAANDQPIGIQLNLGGFVNRAAFKTIAPVVAKDGGAANHTDQMDKKELQEAMAEALKPIGDRIAALEGKTATPSTAAARETTPANADLTTTIQTAVASALKPISDRLEKTEQRTQTALARAAIQPHINRGAIAPQDNDAINGWEASWLANAKFAEAQMAKLPGCRPGGRIVMGGSAEREGATAAVEPQDRMMSAAAKAVEKNPKLTTAEALIAHARSSEGQAEYQEFRRDFAVGRN
jgi:hypothetical protein